MSNNTRMQVMPAPNGAPRSSDPPNIPSLLEHNFNHIASLIAVVQAFIPYLVTQKSAVNDIGIEVDKESVIAASNTFIQCCNRLDSILEDDRRWLASGFDELKTALKNLYDTQVTVVQESRQLAAETVSPHILLRPALKQRENGTWEARYGVGKNALVGLGGSPIEAMRQFNLAYYGRLQNE